MFWIGHGIGGGTGAVVVFLLLSAGSYWMYRKSQEHKIDHSNVTDEWDRPKDVLDQGNPAAPNIGTHEVPFDDTPTTMEEAPTR
jgi:hypothetical protein